MPASLRVDFHELILGDHLLERAESGLDLGAGGDVIGDIVDEGGFGDPARIALCPLFAVGWMDVLAVVGGAV